MTVDCSREDTWENYGVDSLDDCCETMNSYGYDALGCTVMAFNDPFDDESLNVKTDSIYNTLNGKNMYKSFELKNSRLVDLAGWCQHQGWNQGVEGSDCFLDSILFAFFGNNNLSTELSKLLDDIYNSNSTVSNLHKIAYIMALYGEYLKVGSSIRGKLDTSNVKVDDIDLTFKQAMKWCLIWYSIKEFKIYHDKSSKEYEEIVLKIASNTAVDTFDIDGSEPLLILKIFSVIFSPHDKSNIFKIAEKSIDEPVYTDEDNIDLVINDNLSKFNNIVIIPYYGPLPHIPRLGRMYNLFNNPKASLEAIIQGTSRHVIAYTKCNEGWLYYNNMVSPTTSAIEDNDSARGRILELMRKMEETGSNLIIMKKQAGLVPSARQDDPRKSRASRKTNPPTRKRTKNYTTLRSGRVIEGVEGGYRKRKSKGKKQRKYTKKYRKSKKNTKRRKRRRRTERK